MLNLCKGENRLEKLRKTVQGEPITNKIVKKFNPAIEFTEADMISMLYYLGYLTISGEKLGLPELTIPNKVMKEIYANYFMQIMEEEANFKIGKSTDETKIAEIRKAIYETEAKLEPATGISTSSEIPVSECYKVTAEAMKQWGLDKVELKNKEYYLIKFDDSNATVEVYNTLGYNGRYSLTEIDNIEK